MVAVVAKKCARFCHRTTRQSRSRTYDSCDEIGRLPAVGSTLRRTAFASRCRATPGAREEPAVRGPVPRPAPGLQQAGQIGPTLAHRERVYPVRSTGDCTLFRRTTPVWGEPHERPAPEVSQGGHMRRMGWAATAAAVVAVAMGGARIVAPRDRTTTSMDGSARCSAATLRGDYGVQIQGTRPAPGGLDRVSDRRRAPQLQRRREPSRRWTT